MSSKSFKDIQDSTKFKITNMNEGYAKTTTAILGYGRALTGVAIFMAPQFCGKLFKIPITAQSALLARGMGSRDMALGGVLLAANNSVNQPGGKREVKRALHAGLLIDVLDVGATTYGFATGQVGKLGAGMFGSVAAGCAVLGLIGLRSLGASG